MKITVSNYMYKKCEAFADERTKDVDHYKRRGGFKWQDIMSGALAEVACYNYLRSLGFEVTKPDFGIHAKKSYDADLSDGNVHFHIKGQTLESAKKYGNSWLMQRNDPIINNPEKKHYLMPCSVDIDTGKVEIFGCIALLTIISQDLVGECRLEWFRKTKIALYWDDFKEKLQKAQRWSILY